MPVEELAGAYPAELGVPILEIRTYLGQRSSVVHLVPIAGADAVPVGPVVVLERQFLRDIPTLASGRQNVRATDRPLRHLAGTRAGLQDGLTVKHVGPAQARVETQAAKERHAYLSTGIQVAQLYLPQPLG